MAIMADLPPGTRLPNADAGIIDQDIDPVILAPHCFCHRADRSQRGKIGQVERPGPPCLPDFGKKTFGPNWITTMNQNGGACGCHSLGHPPPNAIG